MIQSRFRGLYFLTLVIAYAAFFVLPQTAFATSQVARWQFDEGVGSTTVDSVNNISGVFIKGSSGGSAYPTWSTDRPPVAYSNPYALSFEGLQDGIRIAWPSGLNFTGTAPRSFSFWYKPTANGETAAGNYDRILSWTGDAFEIAGTLGDVSVHRLAFYDGSWRDTTYNMTVGTWYNLTFTYDGTNVRLYVDNSQKFSGTLGGRNLSGNLYIGVRHEINEGINGIIDDVKIYDYALTTDQIANLTAGSDDPDEAPDTTAPAISSVASSTSSTSATVTWTTDEAGSTQVAYSVDMSFASSTSEADTSTRVTSHSKTLSGLLSCTWYNFKAVSADAAGNYATSSRSTFLTTGCVGGATPSTVASTTVAVSSAATSTSSDNGRTLVVATPANFTATSSSVVIQIKGLDSSTVLSSIGKPASSLSSAASIVFDVTALINSTTVLDSFDTPVTVSYTYTDADISGLDESSLSMYHYANGAWSELDDCSVNTSTNTITCNAPHFSVFAIFGTVPAASSSNSTASAGVGAAQPWCSGPTAPGWNNGLPDGGCGALAVISAPAPKLNTCPAYVFTRALKFGVTGEDVRALQKLMNCLGFTLAASGPGAPGEETNLFVNRTYAAVIQFQETYAADILIPLSLKKGTGIFAELSRKKSDMLINAQ